VHKTRITLWRSECQLRWAACMAGKRDQASVYNTLIDLHVRPWPRCLKNSLRVRRRLRIPSECVSGITFDPTVACSKSRNAKLFARPTWLWRNGAPGPGPVVGLQFTGVLRKSAIPSDFYQGVKVITHPQLQQFNPESTEFIRKPTSFVRTIRQWAPHLERLNSAGQ